MRYQLSRRSSGTVSTRALSLVETVLAVFLLAAQILLLAGLLAQFNRTQRDTRQRSRAALLAEQKMDEIRAWARQPGNFAGDWSVYQGQVTQPPEDPGFRLEVRVNSAGQPLYSPCLGLESPYDTKAKLLHRSCVPVRVSVSWAGREPLVLNSLIGEPVRPKPYTLTFAPDPPFTQPVPTNGPFGYKAQLQDGLGLPIEDVMFSWRVKPLTGNASLVESPNRNQRQVRAQHAYLRYGTVVQVSGLVRLECRALYHGQLILLPSDPVQLQ